MSINRVIMIGNLTKDPELKFTTDGTAICNFTVAMSEKYTTKDGERKEQVEFIGVSCFKKQAENAGKYLFKGSMVYVEGKIQTRSWEDDKGDKRKTTSVNAKNIQFLSPKKDGGTEINKAEVNEQYTGDDIPF